MGILTASGVIGEDGSMPGPPPIEPGDAAPPADSAPPADEGADHAPSDYQPAARTKKPSRREQAIEDAITARFTAFEAKAGQERQAAAARIEAADRRAAMLEGRLQEIQRQPPPVAPAPAAAGPDPAELRRQARKALDVDKDFDAYERLTQQATDIDVERKLEVRLARERDEMVKRIPQQTPPMIVALLSRHQHVAMAGLEGPGGAAVQLALGELSFGTDGTDGMPDGPAKLAKAFELANKRLERAVANRQQQSRGPAFSQDAATALAAVPAPRPAATGGGGGNGADAGLTDLEKVTAKAAGMTDADYKKWKSPEKFIRR